MLQLFFLSHTVFPFLIYKDILIKNACVHCFRYLLFLICVHRLSCADSCFDKRSNALMNGLYGSMFKTLQLLLKRIWKKSEKTGVLQVVLKGGPSSLFREKDCSESEFHLCHRIITCIILCRCLEALHYSYVFKRLVILSLRKDKTGKVLRGHLKTGETEARRTYITFSYMFC